MDGESIVIYGGKHVSHGPKPEPYKKIVLFEEDGLTPKEIKEIVTE